MDIWWLDAHQTLLNTRNHIIAQCDSWLLDTELAESKEKSQLYLRHLTSRSHLLSVTFQRGTRSPSEAGRVVKHDKSSGFGGRGAFHITQAVREVQRGFREESDFTLT